MKPNVTQAQHIEMLQANNDKLLAQIADLGKIVKTIPSIIVNARLDAKLGVETKYDYAAAAKALAIR